MFANYWPTSKMSTVVSSGGCYSVACWIQPHVRNNRKTLRQKTVAISSKITLRGGGKCFGLVEIQSLFLSFARDCLQSTGDDCGGVPPATFFVVDETTSEKNRKGKKNPRYLTFGLGVSFPLKAYRFSVWRWLTVTRYCGLSTNVRLWWVVNTVRWMAGVTKATWYVKALSFMHLPCPPKGSERRNPKWSSASLWSPTVAAGRVLKNSE